MDLRKTKSLSPVAAFFLLGLAAAAGQTQDNSQNALLKGSYRFRDVAVQAVDTSYNPTDMTATYGTITFDGAGNYTITGTQVDNIQTAGLAVAFNATGTYAIGSNGGGYITNPNYPTDVNALIYGFAAQGVFAGSATESEGDGNVYNDIFIAIPVGSAPANSSFTSAYQTGVLDFTGAGSTAIKNALFELTPNGRGGFGTISLTGQAANQTASTLSQSITGATYNFNADSSATLTIPLPSGVTLTNALFTGTKTLYESSDGNFILGWSATGYDIFFGVKALAVTGTNSLSQGLYFTTALEDAPAGYGTDSYYGGTNNTGDSAGDAIVHERQNIPDALSFDYGTDDNITVNADGTTPTDVNGYNYIFGDGGQAFVAIGSNGFFSLQVGLHAPSFSGTGVYLNPIGVANAASFQPVTASIAPGEMILLFGSGLASATVSAPAGQPLPTSLGGVSVTIDNLPCPIFFVSSGELSIAVPYGVAANQTGLANIQVTNNNVPSNIVQVYLTDAEPGAFSANANGIGFAAAVHAATGQVITAANPVVAGEFISLYLTGLGTVTPTAPDGALGPASPLSWSDVYNAGSLAVYFNDYTSGTSGNAGTIQFAGLAPYFAGLYQINVQVPTSGLVSGDSVYVEFVTDAAEENQIQIPFGPGATPLDRTGGSALVRTAGTPPDGLKARSASIVAARARRAKSAVRRMPRGGPAVAGLPLP